MPNSHCEVALRLETNAIEDARWEKHYQSTNRKSWIVQHISSGRWDVGGEEVKSQ